MNINLSTKERLYLEDLKSHEENCITKYSNYANVAKDQHLKDIFINNGSIEQEHLNSLNQIMSGQIPSMNQQGSGGSTQQQQQAYQPQSNFNNNFQLSDKELCTDMLSTEKQVSSTYNTAIFEFRDTQIRDVLNHIQKEEQKHGEAIFKYMESNGMYNAQQ